MAPPSAGLHTHILLLVIAFTLDAGSTVAINLHGDDISNNIPQYYADTCTEADFHAKDLDVVLYGATGFVGELASEYLAKGHPDQPRWAVAGRDTAKVNALYYKHSLKLETAPAAAITADMQDLQKLSLMVRRAKVVLSFAGPYEPSGGEELIRAAMESCTHYVDVAGETQWKAYIMNKYGKIAKKRNLAIVQSAGFYSMAADLMAMFAARDLTNKGIVPGEVMVVWTKLNGHFTGGQTASLKWQLGKYGHVHDPYILSPESTSKQDPEPSGFKSNGKQHGKYYGYDPRLGIAVWPYKGAEMDCAVIRRSMEITFRGAEISVKEANNISVDEYHDMFSLPSYKYPRHPQPGDGPTGYLRDMGSALGFAVASASENDEFGAMVIMEAHGDPATVATPRMAVELALGLAKNGPWNKEGGYLTPATSVAGLEDRLQRIQLDQGPFITFTHPKQVSLSGSRN